MNAVIQLKCLHDRILVGVEINAVPKEEHVKTVEISHLVVKERER